MTSLDGTIQTGVLLFVGVVVPTPVDEYLDRRDEDAARGRSLRGTTRASVRDRFPERPV